MVRLFSRTELHGKSKRQLCCFKDVVKEQKSESSVQKKDGLLCPAEAHVRTGHHSKGFLLREGFLLSPRKMVPFE